MFLRLLDSNVRSVYEHAKLPSGCSSYSPFLLRIHPEQRYAYCTHTAPFDPMKVWDVVSCIVQDLAHFFSGQLLFQSIASQVSNLRGLLFSIGREKIDNLRTRFFFLCSVAPNVASTKLLPPCCECQEKDSGQPRLQSSVVMPNAASVMHCQPDIHPPQ